MKITKAIATAAMLALTCGAAEASNGLYIISDDDIRNVASLNANGSGNRVFVVQDHDGLSGANRLTLDIEGDLNGGPLNAYFGPLMPDLGLAPGRIKQIGHDNAMRISVTGSQNLFSMSQNGYGNQLTAVVTGNYNQAAVMQIGNGNSLSFTQNGNGNMLSVVQRSR
jgi:hypothetical protein